MSVLSHANRKERNGFCNEYFWHRLFKLIKSTVRKNKLTLMQLESQCYAYFFFVVVWAICVLNLLVLKVAIGGKITKIFKATFGRILSSRSQLSSLFLGPERQNMSFLVLVACISGHGFERFWLNI